MVKINKSEEIMYPHIFENNLLNYKTELKLNPYLEIPEPYKSAIEEGYELVGFDTNIEVPDEEAKEDEPVQEDGKTKTSSRKRESK